MAELHDFVESKLALAASKQKSAYDNKSNQRSFKVNDPVWLSDPTAGKLDPKCEGNWKILAMKGPVNVKITDGHGKVVHINRIQPCILPSFPTSTSNNSAKVTNVPWSPPQIEHFVDYESESEPLVRQNPPCQQRPPDYYRPARGRA